MKLRVGLTLYRNSHDFQSLGRRSQSTYRPALKRLAVLEDKHIKSITKVDIEIIRSSLTPGAAQMFTAVAKKIWNFFIQHDMADKMVVHNMKHEPQSHPMWTDEDISKFMEVAPSHVCLPVKLALLTGQRITTILNLKAEDYDGKFVKFPPLKKGNDVYIKASSELVALLMGKTGYICTDLHGRPYNYQRYERAFSTFRSMAGINKTIHGLRVAHAVTLAENGATSKEIQHRLGHKTMKMAELYTRSADLKKTAISLEGKIGEHFDRQVAGNWVGNTKVKQSRRAGS